MINLFLHIEVYSNKKPPSAITVVGVLCGIIPIFSTVIAVQR
jgi:hypothetical protein